MAKTGNLGFRQSHEFRNNIWQSLFALVNRDDNRNTMGTGRRACHCIGHVYRVYRFGGAAVPRLPGLRLLLGTGGLSIFTCDRAAGNLPSNATGNTGESNRMTRITLGNGVRSTWQTAASATAILLSSLMYWILHVRPLTTSEGFSWGSFREYFPYDQYSYLAIAVNVKYGNLAAVEPFTETGTNHYPRLYYVILGLLSRLFDTDIITTWQLTGLAFQFVMVAAISWLLIRMTGLSIFGVLGFVPSIIGTFAVAAGGNWYHSLDNHAVLWGAFGVLFTLNGESAALCIAVTAICILIGVTFPFADGQAPIGSRARAATVTAVAAAVGVLANVQTYSFLTAVYLLLYTTAAYGLLTYGRKWHIFSSAGLLVAVLLGGNALTATTGPLMTLVAGLSPAAPGFLLVLLRYKATVIAACVSMALAASPTVIGTLLGLVEKDDFLTYRETSSNGLGVPALSGVLGAGVPLFMLLLILWAGVSQANKAWIAFAVGPVVAWPLVASNDLWGANQEPYRFWIDSFTLVSAAALPVLCHVAVRSWHHRREISEYDLTEVGAPHASSGGRRKKSLIFVATGVTLVVAFAVSLADYARFAAYVHENGTASFNDPQALAIKSATLPLTQTGSDLHMALDESGQASELVMFDPCISPFRVKALTGLPIAFYNLGLAWPSDESGIRDILMQRSQGTFAQQAAEEVQIHYLLTDTGCPTSWSGQVEGSKISDVAYDNGGKQATLTLWKLTT
jgi:hypothetical protein